MKTREHTVIQFNSPNSIFIAFGIDGEIVHFLNTSIEVFNLIKNNKNVEENVSCIDCVDIKDNDGNILDTLQISKKICAILRSNPDIIELSRYPTLSPAELGEKYWVDIGWKYDNKNNIIPPDGWIIPEEPGTRIYRGFEW
jgi:hypothetical protein